MVWLLPCLREHDKLKNLKILELPGTEDTSVGEEQPTLRQILQAVHKCTASIYTVKECLAGSDRICKRFVNEPPQHKRPGRQASTPIAESRSNAFENKDKTDDIEDRLRCNNVRIVGLPEKVKGRDSTEFTEHWLIDTFGKEAFSFICGGEGTLSPHQSITGQYPRPVLAHILHYRDREKVLRLARERPNIQYNKV